MKEFVNSGNLQGFWSVKTGVHGLETTIFGMVMTRYEEDSLFRFGTFGPGPVQQDWPRFSDYIELGSGSLSDEGLHLSYFGEVKMRSSLLSLMADSMSTFRRTWSQLVVTYLLA